MKKYFIYCTPCVGVKTYIGLIECEEVKTQYGVTFFYRNGEIILSLVANLVEIEDRTEPDTE